MDKAVPTVVTSMVMELVNAKSVPVETIVYKGCLNLVQILVKDLFVHYVLQQGVLLKGVQQDTLKEESVRLVLLDIIVKMG